MEIFRGKNAKKNEKGGGVGSLAWISAPREEGDVREEARGGP